MREQHILVVDDEERLVKMIDYLLVKNGYKVSTALSAEDALDKAKHAYERGERIDLLITDMVMSGMSGSELIEEIDKSGMNMKTLAISGKIKDPQGDISHKKLNGFLSKPFGPTQLVEEIKEIMRGRELSYKKVMA